MMELQKGRPMDTTGRLAKETRTYDLLDSLGIEYNRIDHAPAMTMEVCQEIDKTLQAVICKNLFLCNRQETAFYLLMIPDTKVFHTKDLSAQIGSARLSFAKAEYMQQLLDITPGSVSVLGLMNDTAHKVQLLIDEDVLEAGVTDAAQEKHVPAVTVEGSLVKVDVGSVTHPMTAEHFIQWVVVETERDALIHWFHPEEAPEVVFALAEGQTAKAVYAYCNLHSLWKA